MISATPDRYSLLADIGGTNTRVALAEGGKLIPASIKRYANAGRPALEPILADYMQTEGVSDLAGACVAAAGPVHDGVAQMTNLSWVIEDHAIARVTKAETVAVLNDLQAQGHALGHLAPGAVRVIDKGAAARPNASQLVVGVGTGFNAAPVHEAPGGRIVAASECGHITLPTVTDEDIRLMRFVEEAHGFAAVEDVLSGRGLERVYAFAAREAGQDSTLPAAQVMEEITARSALGVATARIFTRHLGAVVGDLALVHLPFGGIHLCGGVARAFTPLLHEFGFLEAMRAKGRFAEFLQAFPVAVIEDDYAALSGCAAHLHARAPQL
ncbi:glucokinase [Rhodobacter sp. TJ_12]|uniref:glucokinase n=1 Tax=Rhodobacter sp. TJ_12 TaxID=2029399 RepID=UPI001CBB71D7|nr:glucokinase [Rhodobacter sp. TJ_12]MBZ4022432.1 glucokinase [Rhodobacter sp. TJ_12]